MDKPPGSRARLADLTRPECEYFRRECNFTPDELEVFNLAVQDKSIVQISMGLSLSTRTVDRRIQSIKSKIIKVS